MELFFSGVIYLGYEMSAEFGRKKKIVWEISFLSENERDVGDNLLTRYLYPDKSAS